jgi:hypothetical protein
MSGCRASAYPLLFGNAQKSAIRQYPVATLPHFDAPFVTCATFGQICAAFIHAGPGPDAIGNPAIRHAGHPGPRPAGAVDMMVVDNPHSGEPRGCTPDASPMTLNCIEIEVFKVLQAAAVHGTRTTRM